MKTQHILLNCSYSDGRPSVYNTITGLKIWSHPTKGSIWFDNTLGYSLFDKNNDDKSLGNVSNNTVNKHLKSIGEPAIDLTFVEEEMISVNKSEDEEYADQLDNEVEYNLVDGVVLEDKGLILPDGLVASELQASQRQLN